MGIIYMEELKNFAEAEEYFIEALCNDPCHIQTCEKYMKLAIMAEGYEKAEKLFNHAIKIKGVDKATFYDLMAYSLEVQCRYQEAISCDLRHDPS